MAGVGGIEPPHGGIKSPCLTAWRHPNNFYLGGRNFNKGDLLTPLATKPCHGAGICLSTNFASASEAKDENKHAPVPVNLA